MGGEGSMLHAIKSLKNNRNLLKRKDKASLSGSYSNLELKDFLKATPEQIKAIGENMQKEKKRTTVKLIIIFVVFLVALFAVFVYLIQ